MTAPPNTVPDDARRALVLNDRPLLVDLIQLTLNHGLFVVQSARDLAEATAILDIWAPANYLHEMEH